MDVNIMNEGSELREESSSSLGEASQVIGGLNHDLIVGVSPIPPPYEHNAKYTSIDRKVDGDNSSGAKRPRAPKVAPTTRSNRRPAATWHTVGVNGAGVASPRKPRYATAVSAHLDCIGLLIGECTCSLGVVLYSYGKSGFQIFK